MSFHQWLETQLVVTLVIACIALIWSLMLEQHLI